ncbi:MAG: acyl-CoA dehydrogenase family protein [Deltaproteobacteria bacterium]|nr:acyl-CoA dehydrogenase family protein [Deltaproteobacteria bacterium]
MIPDDFGYGEDQAILRQGARKYLEAECNLEKVRKIMESDAGYEEPMWKHFGEMGWLGLAVPEDHGGSGLGMVSLATLMEEMGRALLPAPFLGTVLATLAIREGGSPEQQAKWLPAIASGDLKATLAVTEEEGAWDLTKPAATATAKGGAIVLDGVKVLAPDASSAQLVIASFREGNGMSLFAIDRGSEGLSVAADVLVDQTRRSGMVTFKGVAADESARLGKAGGGGDILAKIMPSVWTALAAEMAGGMERVFQITLDYAKVREQFGKQIGAFQAVKHPLVNVMVDIEMTRSLVYHAAAAIDHEPENAERTARMAKAFASEAYANAAARAVQLHGGIGFTWECDVHLFFKRAQWSKFAFGDAAWHRRHIADMTIGG